MKILVFLLTLPLITIVCIKADTTPAHHNNEYCRIIGIYKDYVSNRPISEAIVEIFAANGQLVRSTMTNRDGKYVILLPKGRYTVKITHNCYEKLVRRFIIPLTKPQPKHRRSYIPPTTI